MSRGPSPQPETVLERFYWALLTLLPPSVRRADAEAIRWTLRDQLEAAPSTERGRITRRALFRLPAALVREWMDELGIGRGGAPLRRKGEHLMGRMWKNLTYALRALRKAPTFTLTSVALIGLGVGTVTMVYTVVDDVLLRSLPYPAGDRLVYLTNGSHNGSTLERLDGVAAFDLWAPTSTSSVNLTRDGGEPLRLRRTETTPAFFTMFGAKPEAGRLFGESDRGNLGIAVVTWQAWQNIWGGRTDLVGSTVHLDGEPIEIVGVLGRDFVQPAMVLGDPVHLFRPMDWTNPGLSEPGYHAHSVTARLGSGISMETADAQMDVVAESVAEAFPGYYSDGRPDWPLITLHERTVGDFRRGLMLLLAAVVVLMLVACTNVAHLFMARGITRAREMAIRRAVGAGRRHILGQLTLESLAVGVAGGTAGLGIAAIGLRLFAHWTVELPRGATVSLDYGVLGVAIALATGSALLFGLVPTARAVGMDVQNTLRAGGRAATGSRALNALRSGMVVAEVALSLVLVATGGLLIRSFAAVTSQDPGVDPRGVYVVPLNLAGIDSPETYRLRMDEIRRSASEVPGIEAVTYGLEAPFEFVGGDACCMSSSWVPEDQADATPLRVRSHSFGEDFLETYGTDLVAGRVWTQAEVTQHPLPSVISEALAIRAFGSAEAAIGREISIRGGLRIVGVAEQTLHYGLDQPHDYATYSPMELVTFPIGRAVLGLRAAQGAAGMGNAIRKAIWAVEPNLPVPTVTTMDAWIERSSSTRRFRRAFFGAFGTVALLLAAAGLYGTLLYAVGQRRRELGIRLALGAGRRRVQREVLQRGVVLAAAGVAIGTVIVWFTGRLLQSFLFGITPADPVALGGSAGILLLTAVVAAWLPAWRAGRTDPLETLNAE